MTRRAWIAAFVAWPLATAAHALDLDLPRVAAPCPEQGPRFSKVPGTETCLRIGGRVTAEAGTARRAHPGDPGAAAVAAGARVDLDARTETELGPARTFIRLRGGSATR
ncbi:porin [Methylobacterium sp. JK268]